MLGRACEGEGEVFLMEQEACSIKTHLPAALAVKGMCQGAPQGLHPALPGLSHKA